MPCSAGRNIFPSSTAFKSHLQPPFTPGPHPLRGRHQKSKSERHPSPQPGSGGSSKTDFPLLFLSCYQQERSSYFLWSFFSWLPERLPFSLCFAKVSTSSTADGYPSRGLQWRAEPALLSASQLLCFSWRVVPWSVYWRLKIQKTEASRSASEIISFLKSLCLCCGWKYLIFWVHNSSPLHFN